MKTTKRQARAKLPRKRAPKAPVPETVLWAIRLNGAVLPGTHRTPNEAADALPKEIENHFRQMNSQARQQGTLAYELVRVQMKVLKDDN